DLSAAKKVTLAGGAQARNVFWQVAGQVTIHANAHFEGNILCQTAITLQTTASMKGRALAQTLIALDDNAITAP
ncbi:MAG TPA: ice-binding family protein, partial [Polyangia bacterium]|nr:ice-binding family protein [Polyangia bacterium]